MKIVCRLMSVAAAGLLLINIASAQNAPVPNWLGEHDNYYTKHYTLQDDEQDKQDKAPKAKEEDAPPKPDTPNTEPMESADGGEDAYGCCGESDDGCCGEVCGCKCNCLLFGPDEPFVLWDDIWCRSCCKPAIHVGGWIQSGYNSQPTPLSMARGDGLSFNDVPDNFELHQAWVYVEKTVDTEKNCWDWGFRVDMIYGTDAQKTQAFGNTVNAAGTARGWDNDWDHGVYGWALPQAYVELASGNLSVKMGHFFTLVGYEVIPAPDNFFFSHSLTMFNSEPFTHTGAIATYGVCDDLEVYGGWTAGWDTGFDANNGGSSWMGGFSATLIDDVKFIYICTAGNFGARGKDAYSHSMVFDFTLTDHLTYVLQSDLVRVNKNPNGTRSRDREVGVNQYLFYTYNDCIKFGARFEWWKADTPTDGGSSNYEFTYGVNIRPHANLIIRPEIRHDWSPAANFREDIFAVDVIATF